MNKKMTVSTFTTQYINCKKESDRNSLVRILLKGLMFQSLKKYLLSKNY